MHVFASFGADLHAQSMLINKISASELGRKFVKSGLFGWVCVCENLHDDGF